MVFILKIVSLLVKALFIDDINAWILPKQPSKPSHPIITRAKVGISKSKTYIDALQDLEPIDVKNCLTRLQIIFGYERKN